MIAVKEVTETFEGPYRASRSEQSNAARLFLPDNEARETDAGIKEKEADVDVGKTKTTEETV